MGGYGAAFGGIIGGFAGAQKKGGDFQLGNDGEQAQQYMSNSLNAYNNLVQGGPNASDVTNATNASKGYASALQNASQTGGFNMSMGNQLAQQQFAGQRSSMEQSFQDQLAQANRAASLSGRSSNDPILRARLAQDQTRQQAQLSANQSSAAMGLGLQYTQNSLGLQGQQVGVLQGLSNQAFSNQSNLFQMSTGAYNNSYDKSMTSLSYENSRGGGSQGMMQGMMQGMGAGSAMGGGSSMFSGQTSPGTDRAGGTTSMSSDYLNGGAGYGGGGSSMSLGASSMGGNQSSAQTFAPQAAPAYSGRNIFMNSGVQSAMVNNGGVDTSNAQGPWANPYVASPAYSTSVPWQQAQFNQMNRPR